MSPRCQRCHRILKTPEAIEAGYGRVCYLKMFHRKMPGPEHAARISAAGTGSIKTRAVKPGEIGPIPPLFLEDIECRRVDGQTVTNVPPRISYYNRGFEWGYLGRGPKELALNILSLFVDKEQAFDLHLEFYLQFITVLPYEGGTILKEQVLSWLEVQEQSKTAAPTDQSKATV